MIFSTLARYFLKRYLITAIWFLLGVSAIIYLADFSETARRMSSVPGYSVPGALGLTALRLPLILQQTIPFIALFVGMTTLISLNRRYESRRHACGGGLRLAIHSSFRSWRGLSWNPVRPRPQPNRCMGPEPLAVDGGGLA